MLPTFVVIGAMKCATTSLHYYLDLHPDIFMSQQKELDFFIAERQWRQGLRWYESQFSDDGSVNGESSTGYTKFPCIAGVPRRMHSILPDARLIYLVRDPVERIVSHYVHEYAMGRERRPFGEALRRLEHNHYLDVSRYHLQLRRFLEYYSPDSILIVATEDLKNQRLATLQHIFRFLNVNDRFQSPKFSVELGQSAEMRRKNRLVHLLSKVTVQHYRLHAAFPAMGKRVIRMITGASFARPVLDAPLRHALIDVLRDDVAALRQLTGMHFASWCV